MQILLFILFTLKLYLLKNQMPLSSVPIYFIFLKHVRQGNDNKFDLCVGKQELRFKVCTKKLVFIII